MKYLQIWRWNGQAHSKLTNDRGEGREPKVGKMIEEITLNEAEQDYTLKSLVEMYAMGMLAEQKKVAKNAAES